MSSASYRSFEQYPSPIGAKGKAFDTYDAADDNEIEAFWKVLQQVDELLLVLTQPRRQLKTRQLSLSSSITATVFRTIPFR